MQLVRNDVILDETNLTTAKETVVNLSQIGRVSLQVVLISNGPAPLDATLILSASNDGDNYAPLHGASYHATGSGNVVFKCPDVSFKWMKLSYTPVTGNVTLQAILAATDEKQ